MTSGFGSRRQFAHPGSLLIVAFSLSALGMLTSRGAEQATPSIPPPGPEEQKLAVLIGKWQSPFHGERRTSSPPENTDCIWEGKWILNGHLLSLEATNLPKGRHERELDVFGYSGRTKSHYMLAITAGNHGRDEVEVFWFTIDGNVWRFAPTEVRIGDKVIQNRVVWELKSADLTITRTESSEDGIHWTNSGQGEHRRIQGDPTPGIIKALPENRATARKGIEEIWKLPPPGPEMERVPARTGTWPNKHQGPEFYVAGTWDSRSVGDGYFLGWFETNDEIYATSQKNAAPRVEKQREVDIWGYSDTASLYFRIDAVTYKTDSIFPDGTLPAPLVDDNWLWWTNRGKGVAMAIPLEQKIDGKVVYVRWGLESESPDTRTIFEDRSQDGVHWTEYRRWTDRKIR
jgi:hypothetical protein